MRVFLRRNSSDFPARRMLLESVRKRIPLAVASPCTMAVAAATTAGYAWLVGPLLRDLGADSTVQSAPGAAAFPDLSVPQIVWLLVVLGVVRALSETVRTNLASRFQLSTIREFRGEVLVHVLRLEPSVLLNGRAESSPPAFKSRSTGSAHSSIRVWPRAFGPCSWLLR